MLDVPFDVFREAAAEETPRPEDWSANISCRCGADPDGVRKAVDMLMSANWNEIFDCMFEGKEAIAMPTDPFQTLPADALKATPAEVDDCCIAKVYPSIAQTPADCCVETPECAECHFSCPIAANWHWIM